MSDPMLWAGTSVRILRSKHPAYIPATSKKSFSALLTTALIKMKYFHFERVEKNGFSDTSWQMYVAKEVSAWNGSRHDEMVKFLERGGYPALIEGARTVGTSKMSGKNGKAEDIDDIEETLKPASQVSPTHELEDILADAVMRADTRYGSW